MSNISPSSRESVARLCHIIQWKYFDGYGLDLTKKGKSGHCIGKVDEGSPAEAAGLKQGDRIIEVDGFNIDNENHTQVVQRIKALGNEVKLLIVEADYFKAQNIIKKRPRGVLYLKTPMTDSGKVDVDCEKDDGKCVETQSHQTKRSISPETKGQPEKRSYKRSSGGTALSSHKQKCKPAS